MQYKFAALVVLECFLVHLVVLPILLKFWLTSDRVCTLVELSQWKIDTFAVPALLLVFALAFAKFLVKHACGS